MFTVLIILSCLLVAFITLVSLCVDAEATRTGWVLITSGLLIIVGGFAGAIVSREIVRKEAAEAGSGHYRSTTDKLTGRVETEFIWTPKQQPAEQE